MKLYRDEEESNTGVYVVLWILGMVAVSVFAVFMNTTCH